MDLLLCFTWLLVFSFGVGASAFLRRKSKRALLIFYGLAVFGVSVPFLIGAARLCLGAPDGESLRFDEVFYLNETRAVWLMILAALPLGIAVYWLAFFFQHALRGRRAWQTAAAALACCFAAFCVAEGALASGLRDAAVNDVYQYYNNQHANLIRALEEKDTKADLRDVILSCNHFCPHTVSCVVLADTGTREILAENGCTLEATRDDLFIISDLRDRLTPAMLKQIRRHKPSRETIPVPIFASFAKNAGGYEPVVLRLSAGGAATAPLELVFSDQQPDLVLDPASADGSFLYLDLYGIPGGFSTRRELFRRDRLLALIRQDLDAISPRDGMRGGTDSTYTKSGLMTCRLSRTILQDGNGREYAVYLAYGYNAWELAFHTEIFSNENHGLILLGVFLTLLLEMALLSFEKRKRLREESRVAFLSAAAHALKSPLAVIGNSCECALENVSPDKNRHYIETAYRETERTGALLQDILRQNALLAAGKPKKEQTDLKKAVAGALTVYEGRAAEKGLRISVQGDDVSVRVQPALFSMALENLIENAVRYTPPGGEIRVGFRKSKRSALLTVENTGSRIDEADLPHIWEPLYRGDKARTDRSSTGMGLSICKTVFELHRFSYKAENTPDGVRFTVRF